MIVIGAKGKIDVEEVLQKLRKFKFAQVLNADLVCGKEHLEVAYERAKRAFKEKRNRCKNIEMEFMLYASCKRQIKDALEFIGAKNEGRYAFVFDGISKKEARKFVEELGLKVDNRVLRKSIKKLSKFISKEEMKTVDKSFYYDLLFEKMSSLEVMK
ncbi:MAG: hypothetical protein J7L80_03290 [Thermoplasmata archaeon]|nr:hypothetical protein [Thermoplasmata archaeon]